MKRKMVAFIFTLCVLLAFQVRISIEAGFGLKFKKMWKDHIKFDWCCWNIKCRKPDDVCNKEKKNGCVCIKKTKSEERSVKIKFD